MTKHFLYSTFLLLILISSCSVDKRMYRPGYSVNWNSNKKAENTARIELPPIEKIATVPDLEPGETIAEENVSTDSLLQLSSDEDKAIADKAESNPICNAAAAEKRAEALKEPADPVSGFTSSSKKANNKLEFVKGFKDGFHALAMDDVQHLMPLALASLILGIISVIAYYGAFVLGVLAIVFGAVALFKIRQNPGTYRGRVMATWGLVLGIISIAIITTILIFY